MLARRNNEPEPANSRAKMELKTNTPITPASPQEALAGVYQIAPCSCLRSAGSRGLYRAKWVSVRRIAAQGGGVEFRNVRCSHTGWEVFEWAYGMCVGGAVSPIWVIGV